MVFSHFVYPESEESYDRSGNVSWPALDFRNSTFHCIVLVISFLKSFVGKSQAIYKSIQINKIKLYCFPK